MLRKVLGILLAFTLSSAIHPTAFSSSASATDAVVYPSDIQVHAGLGYTCALNDLGAVKCWGIKDMTPPPGLGKIVALSAGWDRVCGVEEGGTLVCWIGGVRTTDVPDDIGNVNKVSVGNASTCVITNTLNLRCWGEGGPALTTQERAKEVSVGYSSFCAINLENKVNCWSATAAKYDPIPENNSAVIKLRVVSAYRGCALTVSKELLCWGFSFGQTKWTGVKNFELGMKSLMCIQQDSETCYNEDSKFSTYGLFTFEPPYPKSYWGQVGIGYSHLCAVKQTKAIVCKDFSAPQSPNLRVPSPQTKLYRVSTDDGSVNITWAKDNFFPAFPNSLKLSPILNNPQGNIFKSCDTDGTECKFDGLSNGSAYFVSLGIRGLLTYEIGEIHYTQDNPLVSVIPKWHITDSVKIVNSGILKLRVSPGTWSPAPNFSYKWFRNGLEVQGETQGSIVIKREDLKARYHAEVKTTNPFFDEISQTTQEVSPAAPVVPCLADVDTSIWLDTKQQPSISGKATIGESLVGATGVWTKGTKICSYWFSNGKAVGSKNVLNYSVPSSLVSNELQFVVVGTSPSGISVTRFSDPVLIYKKQFSNAKAFKIVGKTIIGSEILAPTLSWAPGTKYSYKWKRNNFEIVGATRKSYTISEADLNTKLSLEICGAKADYTSLCKSSAIVKIPLGVISPLREATVKGISSKVGSAIVLDKGLWPNGVSTEISWLRDGISIFNQVGQTYVITNDDRGHTLSVRLNVSKLNYSKYTVNLAIGKIP